MSDETVILKPAKGPQHAVKPTTGQGKAGKTTPTKAWPDCFDIDQAKAFFSPVEDPVALEAFYMLWRIAVTGKGDPSQVQAAKSLIEQRLGRPYSKSPMGSSSVDAVQISYLDPYDTENDDELPSE
jgi:hypothetical protein